MKIFTKLLTLSAAATALALTAHATPTLKLYDAGSNTTLIIADGSAMEAGGANLDGAVTFSGSIGAWDLNVTTGVSGSPWGSMDFTSINSSSSGGALTISFSDIDFTTTGWASTSIGGTIGTPAGFVIYETYWDAGNTLFGTAGLLTSQIFTGSSFSGDDTSSDTISGTYSMTQVVTIQHEIKGSTSFGSSLTVPDQSTTSLLMTLGLLGVGLAARRFAPKKA